MSLTVVTTLLKFVIERADELLHQYVYGHIHPIDLQFLITDCHQ